MMNHEIFKLIVSKLMQFVLVFFGGLWAAFEASTIYFGLCFLAIVIDVISAICLSKRIHRKDPKKSDGKFKSEYKFQVLITMAIVLLALMAAYLYDTIVRGGGNQAQNFVIVAFLIYEIWSVLENWSSENDNKIAILLQYVMVNKAERHFNVPKGTFEDVLLKDKKQVNKEDENGKG